MDLKENGLFLFKEVLKKSETSWEFFPVLSLSALNSLKTKVVLG